MQKFLREYKFELGIAALVVAAVAAFIIGRRPSPVDEARQVFGRLIKGEAFVEKQIDWDNFTAVGLDIYQTYKSFKTEKERARYKQAFITYLSLGFKQVKGKPDAFGNWRIDSQDDKKVVVAADYAGFGKTILLTFTKGARAKLSAIVWK